LTTPNPRRTRTAPAPPTHRGRPGLLNPHPSSSISTLPSKVLGRHQPDHPRKDHFQVLAPTKARQSHYKPPVVRPRRRIAARSDPTQGRGFPNGRPTCFHELLADPAGLHQPYNDTPTKTPQRERGQGLGVSRADRPRPDDQTRSCFPLLKQSFLAELPSPSTTSPRLLHAVRQNPALPQKGRYLWRAYKTPPSFWFRGWPPAPPRLPIQIFYRTCSASYNVARAPKELLAFQAEPAPGELGVCGGAHRTVPGVWPGTPTPQFSASLPSHTGGPDKQLL